MITLDTHRDVLKKFVNIYGSIGQLDMLSEKMAVLSQKIHRYKRKINKCKTEDERKSLESDCEKALADVFIFAEQALLIFNEANVNRSVEQAITKQKEKLTI